MAKRIERPSKSPVNGQRATPTAARQGEADASEPDWLAEDFSGQLGVDVFETEDAFIIESTIAGVRPEELDVSVANDLVTIKGIRRHEQTVPDSAYLFRECYWGGFSRRIILPAEVRADGVEATLKDGVLRVRLPKAERPKTTKTVRVQSDDDADAEDEA